MWQLVLWRKVSRVGGPRAGATMGRVVTVAGRADTGWLSGKGFFQAEGTIGAETLEGECSGKNEPPDWGRMSGG